jgi:hypothetical protein
MVAHGVAPAMEGRGHNTGVWYNAGLPHSHPSVPQKRPRIDRREVAYFTRVSDSSF